MSIFKNIKPDYTEIFALDAMLNEAGIPHTLCHTKSWLGVDGYQIRAYYDETMTDEIDDCIYHSFSHGYEVGLLESFKLNDCNGYETAEEIFKGWQAWYLEKNN